MNTEEVAGALAQVYDPELGVDLVSLGLIYAIETEPERVRVEMTMTSASCPMSGAMLEAVGRVLHHLWPAARVEVVPVFDPPWDVGMVNEQGRRWLGLPAVTSKTGA
jgi:metal-sulfur cluster biosynthetic enzyme